ncbi:hypothetical protein [Kosakonia pseudosacchari]|uniref:hypothetical protein n=1 Tax=Kosakonia pseudosacchari TaxID=1646340 RepID=UPI0018820BB0|nr:hypothetical protein [Kosakonia pseudosacchari]QOV66483.1 hypothetical protein IP581_23340 [Kosakonia pseudosacchari]
MKKVPITLLIILISLAPAHAEIMTSLRTFNELFSESAETDKFQALKQESEKAQDAWQAYLTVTRSVPADINNNLRDKYRQLAITLALKAARANNPDALTLVYTRDDVDVPEFLPARQQMVNALLTVAEKASGTAGDARLLLAAGDVLQNGRLVVQNSLRAAAFYARAWHAGSDVAASRLNSLFMSIKDPASAYLWALRCTGNCALEEGHKASDMLTPRQITSVQGLARDSRVLTVNGLGSQEDIR